MSSWPILYFRSFRNQNSPTVFNKIIANSVNKFGVVQALSNKLQPPSKFHQDIDIPYQAHISIILDDKWKIWVKEKLKRAFAVIIDMTIDSESLSWEFNQAIDLVDLNRITVITNIASRVYQLEGIQQFYYELSKYGEKKTK